MYRYMGSLVPPEWVSARIVCTDWVVGAGRPSLSAHILPRTHNRGALSLDQRRRKVLARHPGDAHAHAHALTSRAAVVAFSRASGPCDLRPNGWAFRSSHPLQVASAMARASRGRPALAAMPRLCHGRPCWPCSLAAHGDQGGTCVLKPQPPKAYRTVHSRAAACDGRATTVTVAIPGLAWWSQGTSHREELPLSRFQHSRTHVPESRSLGTLQKSQKAPLHSRLHAE